RLSESFAELWPLLGQELDVQLAEWRPADVEPPPPGAAIVLIAAGGAELDLPAFLHGLSLPSDIPTAAVGAATSHRLAAHPRVAANAGGAGRAIYFAWPDDGEALRGLVAGALPGRRARLAGASRARLEAEAHAFREIVGESPALRATLERAARVLPHADATVL